MRFLLISDTHGRLGIINELAGRTRADAVIHAGDFGFYDEGSYERLSEREIGLQITHSELPSDEKTRMMRLSRSEKIAAVKSARLLGEFQSYIDRTESFRVPIYAVWGNHEDRDVVERLVQGEIKVGNLQILDGTQTFKVGSSLIYGIGGNLLPGAKMLQKAIAGGSGRIWTTLAQCADLVRTIDIEVDWPGPRIFVSHVSPGKEPFVEFLGARTRADFTISGHMASPTCMVWNPFAIGSVDDSMKRLQGGLDAVRHACSEASAGAAAMIESAFALIDQLSEEAVLMGRGIKAPRWHRDMTHINLSDAHVGYAVLDIEEDCRHLQTFAT
jgi:predicted phosphodiesterase